MVGSDYTSFQSDEIFLPGSADNFTRCVEISIIDDDVLEGDQTFTLTLTTLDSDVMLGNYVTTISIEDNYG